MAMSWEIVRGTAEPTGDMHTVTEHWYLTEDRTRVVLEGDPAGRWLWASPGTEVRKADAIRYGALAPDTDPEPEPEAAAVAEEEPEADKAPEEEPPAEEKKAPAAPNKARKSAANKAATTEAGDK